MFRVGKDGVKAIFTPLDRVSELIVYADKTLVYIRSKMGYPALYPLHEARFDGPAEAVLMDLDGTSVHSEHFWIWVIEQTTARLLGNARFQLRLWTNRMFPGIPSASISAIASTNTVPQDRRGSPAALL